MLQSSPVASRRPCAFSASTAARSLSPDSARARESAASTRADCGGRGSVAASARSPASIAPSRSNSSVARKQRNATNSSRSATGASSDAEASASSTKRRPSETRSASAKYQPSAPNRIAMPGVRCCAGVCERGPEVVVLELELPDAGLPVRSTEPCTCPVGKRRVVLRVGLLRRGQPAALGQTLERVVADGVEHVVARVGTRERNRDDRLVDECPEQLDHRHLVETVVGARRDERGRGAPPRCTATWWRRVFSSACRRS